MSNLINNYARNNIEFVSGDGSYLTSMDGKKYLDFGSGISVTNLGHNHKEVSNIIIAEATKLLHVSNLYLSTPQEELAEVIVRESFQGKLFFCNSGAEANEAAIKLARLYGNKKYGGKKDKILSFNNSFHGRTYATLSATVQEKIQKGFTPIAQYNRFVPFNDIDAVLDIVKNGDIVAIILELYQGESGILPVDPLFLKQLREICDKEDIILIFDEIQTGMGRTGEVFAYKHFGVEPDIMSIAKAMANGLPIGAIVAKDFVADLLTHGTHGTTFGGGSLITKVAKKVIEIISSRELLNDVTVKGELLKSTIESLLNDRVTFHGKGLLIGVETRFAPTTVVSKCLENGLVVIPAGNNTVRLFPPLNISKEDILIGAELFVKSINELDV